jgi:hypothetical protein
MKIRTFAIISVALLAAMIAFKPKPRKMAAPSTSVVQLSDAEFEAMKNSGKSKTATPETISTADIADSSGRIANPFESSMDLRATYLRFKNSRNHIERYIANKAWSACVPAVVTEQGFSVSVDTFSEKLMPSDPRTAQRVEAFRQLQTRCKGFSDMSRDEMTTALRDQKFALEHGDILSPGDIAAKQMSNGNKQLAFDSARAIINSQDPFAMQSLSEFIKAYGNQRPDSNGKPSDERTDLKATAFSNAVCQIGGECSPSSLSATQMCANTGACVGDLNSRNLQSLSNAGDRDWVEKESTRMLEAIRTRDFNALGF